MNKVHPSLFYVLDSADNDNKKPKPNLGGGRSTIVPLPTGPTAVEDGVGKAGVNILAAVVGLVFPT
jgi:hypothetical protein